MIRICEIHHITCACTQFTYTLEKPWTPGVPQHLQQCYQPVKNFTYWSVLGFFHNWNIIQFSHKETSSEDLDKIHQVVLDSIRNSMYALVKTGNYYAINTIYSTTMGYYVIKFLSESYTLQEGTTYSGRISTSGELYVKSQYVNFMQYNTRWYWEEPQEQKNICFKCTIVQTCLDVTEGTEVKNPRSVCNIIKHARLYKVIIYV